MTSPPQPAPKPPRSLARSAVSAAKVALAALLLAWLARSGQLKADAFAALDARGAAWLGACALLQAAMIATMAARWREWLAACALADGRRVRLSWREALVVSARGACVGAWTPAGLGMDGVRWAHAHFRLRGMAGSEAPTRVITLSTLLDRAAALMILLALALPSAASQLPRVRALIAPAAAIGAIAIGAGLWIGLRKRADGGLDLGRASRAAAWSLATHAANVLSLGAALAALEPGLAPARAFGLALEVGPAVILSGAIPLTPLGLGVADAAGEVLLARHGLGSGGEVVMLARASWLAVCLLAGLAFWLPAGGGKVKG